jgi:hypothetical protein
VKYDLGLHPVVESELPRVSGSVRVALAGEHQAVRAVMGDRREAVRERPGRSWRHVGDDVADGQVLDRRHLSNTSEPRCSVGSIELPVRT